MPTSETDLIKKMVCRNRCRTWAKLTQDHMNKKNNLPLSCLAMIFGVSCLQSCHATAVTAPSLSTGFSLNAIADEKSNDSPSPGVSNTNSQSRQVSGSKTPSKWLYSQDKVVACRIKQWASYSDTTYIDFEFTNLRSEEPLNIVYTVAPRAKNGKFIRLFNDYTDNQASLTDFRPPLKKGETKVDNYFRKFVWPSSSVELKGCRVAKKNETFWTINPEMQNYVGP
jgi:hypothetical protein